MKKLYALLFFFINLNLLFSENYFEINSKKLSNNYKIKWKNKIIKTRKGR